MRQQGFVFKQFTLSISQPVTLGLRHQVILSKLEERFRDDYTELKCNFITPVKDVWRLIIADHISANFDGSYEQEGAPFTVALVTSHEDIISECAIIFSKFPHLLLRTKTGTLHGDKTASQYTHAAVQRAINELGSQYFAKLALNVPNKPFVLESVQCVNDSVYVVGRYNKYRLVS